MSAEVKLYAERTTGNAHRGCYQIDYNPAFLRILNNQSGCLAALPNTLVQRLGRDLSRPQERG